MSTKELPAMMFACEKSTCDLDSISTAAYIYIYIYIYLIYIYIYI